ncbi:MAG: DEAD/DEAH box helicase [Myxococcota bacterium]
MSTFSTLPLLPSLLESLAEQGLIHPTPIQAQTLQPQLNGRSLLGISETGSGKTLAYALPLLHRLKTLELGGSSVSNTGSPRGLILVPGRELGEQVARVLKGLTHRTRLRVRVVLGGSRKKIARQNVAGKFEILVATPGRLVQLLDSGELRLSDVRVFVLDEADQMVDPGFLPVAERILSECPKKVQRVMFSATLPRSLDRAMSALFHDPPVRVQTKGSLNVVPTLQTINRHISARDRKAAIVKELHREPTLGTILFVNTRDQLDRVAGWLDDAGIRYTVYRGQLDRQERRLNLASFRDGEVNVLIATDLGGRGLDIERVERVINAHLPQDMDNYLHRVGRTARAGRDGVVINLVTQRDHPLLKKLPQ